MKSISDIKEGYRYMPRIDVDNQLGSIYIRLQYKFTPEPSIYKLYPPGSVDIVPDFVDIDIANAARSFAAIIPFDKDISRLNDSYNQPRENIMLSLNSQLNVPIPPEYAGSLCKDFKHGNNWTWENYNTGIFRVVPLSLDAYIDSPIYDLINYILWKIHRSIMDTTGENLAFGTVVLQRCAQGTYIPEHIDNCCKRRFSFIYYLVPDDWSEDDGGSLILEDRTIHPKFNQLVYWWLSNHIIKDCPDIKHSVSMVNASDDRPRLALVGFFDSR